ncbi:MAG: aldo/keto reductase [Ignavibacteriae bacterium]|nr:aldo/keto reductase [Ignavibacteriota bacterium]
MINRIGIGSVQFGMDYGINNKDGKAGEEEVYEILNYALGNNIDTIDTAIGYGVSERVLGGYKELNKFNVISKIPECKISEIDNYVKLSLNNLKMESIFGYMFHSFETFRRNNDVLDKLREHTINEGVRKIGFSLYHTSELDYLLEGDFKFDIVQIPYSVFDRRFEKYFEDLNKRDIEIHTRSAYMQGLIFMNINTVNEYFNGFKRKLIELDGISNSLKLTNQEIALNFCLIKENISKVIVGFDNERQIKETVESVKKIDVVKQNYYLFEVLKEDDERYLLPFNWKLN